MVGALARFALAKEREGEGEDEKGKGGVVAFLTFALMRGALAELVAF